MRRPSARAVLVAGLWVGAAGSLLVGWAAVSGVWIPPGVVILGVAVVLTTVFRRSRLAAGLGGLAACFVLFSLTASGRLDDLSSPLVALGRWVQFAGCLAAVVALMVGVGTHVERARRERARVAERASTLAVKVAQVGVLVVLSGICAELLAAYNDDTGNPAALLGAMIFFAGLYGVPSLLIREITRRTGRGWPTMLLLAAAFGVFQAGIIDQSIFAEDYGDVEGWEESMRPTRVDVLGLSVFPALSFVAGHVIYSYAGPIAVVEAMRPAAARTPWIGRIALAVATLAYLATAAAIFFDVVGTPDGATAAEFAVTAVVVALLVAVAFTIRPQQGGRAARTPRISTVLILSVVVAVLDSYLPETWLGVAGMVVMLAGAGVLLWRAGRTAGWGPAHTAAAALGWLLVTAILAFTYDPLVGEVSPLRKYAHNVVMLAIVAVAGGHALRRSRATGGR